MATRLLTVATVLLTTASAFAAASDLQKLERQVGRYATLTPIEMPPGTERKGVCLCRGSSLGPSVGVLTMEEFTFSFPPRTVVRMRCWVPSFDTATGAALPGQEDCGPDFVPLAK